MSNSQSNPPRKLGFPGSEAHFTTSTPTTLSSQPSYLRNTGKSSPSAFPATNSGNMKENENDEDSSSSELEEGEISERDLPPLSKPTPNIPPRSARRFRQPPPRPPPKDITQEFNAEYSNRQYRPLMVAPYYKLPTSEQYPSYIPLQPSYTPEPQPVEPSPNDDEDSVYLQAVQCLQEVLDLGLTYDDLIAEGMHPVFLTQAFALLNPQSPRISSRAVSVPNSIATPDIPPSLPPQTITPSIPVIQAEVPARNTPVEVDVDSFLNTLEPTIKANGRDESRKREHPPENTHHHPPKRRAFGRGPPTELVIDVSDDDYSSEDDETQKEPTRPQSRSVKIPERPQLTQQDVVKALKNRELAIAAMKRKIEAKMKNQGVSSNEGLAQSIAVSIIDNNEDTPAGSPMVQSPEAKRDTWLPEDPETATSVPQPDVSGENYELSNAASSKSPEMPPISPPKPSRSPEIRVKIEQETERTYPDINSARLGTATNPIILPSTPPPNTDDSTMAEDDEEARLLAELETERIAEEKARQKRRELEARLANARGRKMQEQSTLVKLEREGQSQQQGNLMEDTMQDILPGDHASENVSGDSPQDPEITIVEDDDPFSDFQMNDVRLENDPELTSSSRDEDKVVLPYKYESPLKIFGTFRFHNLFLTFVPVRGFRSLTYSNHLDPKIPLCRYELSGGICNDPKCEFQHFKTVVLSDQEILRDMMELVIGETPESEKKLVRKEVKRMLNEIAESCGCDFQTLAVFVVQFRQSRLKDALDDFINFS